MRARTAPALLLLGAAALGIGACGSNDEAAGTVSEDITVGTGTEPTSVGGAAAEATTAAGGDSAAAGEDTAAAAPAGDAAAGKEVFSSNCAGCHTLADAGASGAVGPNLDELKPDAALVQTTVTNGKGGMPAFSGSLSEDDIANVAAYVSGAAGA